MLVSYDMNVEVRTPEVLTPLDSLDRTIRLDPDIKREIKRGLETLIYEPYLAEMVNYAAAGVRDGKLDGEIVDLALCDAAMLFHFADQDYREGKEHPLSGELLAKHQANVLAGKIELVPPEFTTTLQQGIRQVQRANQLLTVPEIQATLAAINYGAFFRPQTMASATRTLLDRGKIDKLLATVDSTQEAMPHLSVSNWAIGQIVAGVYRHLAQSSSGRLRIVDIGSGHGATIAAITSSIGSLEGISRRPELAITGLEVTPEFYDELVEFAQKDEGIAGLNLTQDSVIGASQPIISRFGTLTTARGDALNILQRSKLGSGVQDSDITVVTANYSWHRLSSRAKADIMSMFRSLPNMIFIIGDLAQNTSIINSRYFNLGVNGPLNCGNLDLQHQFEQYGYFVVNLERQRPASLDPRLANRISRDDKTNDGHLWIARWGREAFDALNLAPAA